MFDHNHLRFEKGSWEHVACWTGPWPPPVILGIAVGHQTGYVSVFDPAELADRPVVSDDLVEISDVTMYVHSWVGPDLAVYMPSDPVIEI